MTKVDLNELLADRLAFQAVPVTIDGVEYPAFLDNKRRLERLPDLEASYIEAVGLLKRIEHQLEYCPDKQEISLSEIRKFFGGNDE